MDKLYNILVIDDDPNILSSFKRLFFDKNHINILSSTNYNEALKILNDNVVHIVICDQKMPDISGIEILKLIKKDFPGTIRILMTAYSNIDIAIEAINQGEIYRFINKPWNENELLITIEKVIEYIELREKNCEMSEKIIEQYKEIKKNRDWLYSVLISINDGVITIDKDGNITFINPIAEIYTGFKLNEINKDNIKDVFYIIENKKRITLNDIIEKFKKNGHSMKHYKNALLVNKKGIEIPIDFKISPIIDQDGKISDYGMVLVFSETNK